MNLLELKRKLLGRDFRNEDGDGGAGGSMGASDSSSGAGGGPGDSGGGGGADAGAGSNQSQDTSGDGSAGFSDPASGLDGISSGGWSSAQDSQLANDQMAADMVSQYGITNEQAQTALGATNGLIGEVSPGGLTYSAAQSLADQGLGDMTGANPNNPTQTLDQVMASMNVNDAMPYAIDAFKAFVPGAALALSTVDALQNNRTGSLIGGLLGRASGVPLGAQIGAVVGNSVQTGKAPTTGQVGGIIGGYLGSKVGAQIGGEIAGPVGAAIGAKGLGIAGSKLGSSIGPAGEAPSGGMSFSDAVSVNSGGWSSDGAYGGGANDAPSAPTVPSTPTTPATPSGGFVDVKPVDVLGAFRSGVGTLKTQGA